MPAEANIDIKKLIRESKLFSGCKYFETQDLCTEIGTNYDFTLQALGQMAEDGGASKQRVKRNTQGGIMWRYKKCTFTPREFSATSLRRHTNEQMGLEPMYVWSVM